MINLLSRTEQKKIYREYILRIMTLAFLGIGVVGTIFVLVLVPSYVRLQSEIAGVGTQLSMKKAQLTSEDQSQLAEAQKFLTEIRVLQGTNAASTTSGKFEEVIALKPARVTLIGFQYDTTDKQKPKFDIRGKADRREDLLEFKNRLETEAGFTGIDLPAQTLIKRTDIQFTMTLSAPAPTTPSPVAVPSNVEESNDLIPLP